MGLSLYGKHPARGDFIDSGLTPDMLRGLEQWLDSALGEARTELGGHWEAAWATAPVLRFWLGEEVLGQAACGVMTASQDRVGRRFPLVILWSDPAATHVPPPPVIDTAQHWYAHAEAHLRNVLTLPAIEQAASLLAGLDPPAQGDGLPGDADFWAESGQDGATLLSDVALADHRRACAGRSYWWTDAGLPPEPEDLGDVFALDFPEPQGMPEPAEPAAEDAGEISEADAAEEETATEAETTEPEDDPDPAPEEDAARNEETGDEETGDEATGDEDAESPEETGESDGDDVAESSSEEAGETGTEGETDDNPTDETEDTPDDDDDAPEEDSPPEDAPEEEEDDAWAVDADLSPFDTPSPAGGERLSVMPEAVQDTGWIATGAWMDPDLPEDDLPAEAPLPADPPAPQGAPAAAPAPAARPSRFHGGTGLPPGRILAWFLSGG